MNLLTVKELINLCPDYEQEFSFFDKDSGEDLFYGQVFCGIDIPIYILEYTVTSYTIQNNIMFLCIVE